MLYSEDHKFVEKDFTLKYRLPERGVLDQKGNEGAAELRGIPVNAETLEIVAVEIPGWSVRDEGPFPIEDGKVEIVVLERGHVPPSDDTQRPDPTLFVPDQERLQEQPAVAPSKVTLHYQDRSNKNLTLVLFPYSVEENNPWNPKTKWMDFPMSFRGAIYDKFEKGNGWFGIWVRDNQHKYWPLRSHNLFIAPQVLLTIESNDSNEEVPYRIVIEDHKQRN